jgi:hypothetical protein
VLAVLATPRLRLPGSTLAAGVLALAGWCLFAALAPTLLGIDHAGLQSIVKAGDSTALSHALHPSFSSYPLKLLAPIATGVGLLALLALKLAGDWRAPGGRAQAASPGQAHAA